MEAQQGLRAEMRSCWAAMVVGLQRKLLPRRKEAGRGSMVLGSAAHGQQGELLPSAAAGPWGWPAVLQVEEVFLVTGRAKEGAACCC